MRSSKQHISKSATMGVRLGLGFGVWGFGFGVPGVWSFGVLGSRV